MMKISCHCLLMIIMIVLLVSLNGCRSIQLRSGKQSNPIGVDGDDVEWNNFKFSVKERKVTAAMTNDGENLYLALVVNDPKLRKHLMISGLEFTLFSKDNRNQFVSLRFPAVNDNKSDQSARKKSLQDRSEDVNEFDELYWKFSTTTQLLPVRTRFMEENEQDVLLAANHLMHGMVIEMKIPLRYCTKENMTNVVLEKPIKFDLKSGKLTSINRGSGGGNRGGDMRGGGMRGSGMGIGEERPVV